MNFVNAGVTRSHVVTICGSMKHLDLMHEVATSETANGHIVLMPFVTTVGHDVEQKKMLDELHLEKINMADEVIVVAHDGYVGESVRAEISHAASMNRPIRWVV
jgi:hypothetical protein